MKCSTGRILSVGFLELFLWEHVALVPGGFCGTACRAGSLYSWEQRGSSKGPQGQPVASATPQGWCQFGVVHAWIRKDPIRVLVGLCVSICLVGMPALLPVPKC